MMSENVIAVKPSDRIRKITVSRKRVFQPRTRPLCDGVGGFVGRPELVMIDQGRVLDNRLAEKRAMIGSDPSLIRYFHDQENETGRFAITENGIYVFKGPAIIYKRDKAA